LKSQRCPGGGEIGHRKVRKTDREKLKTLLKVLLIVSFEGGSPGLEFGFERHFGSGTRGRRVESGRGEL